MKILARLCCVTLLAGFCGAAFAAVTFRAADSASAASGATFATPVVGALSSAASGNLTPALPAHAAGDLLLCLSASTDTINHTVGTAGWTRIYFLSGTGNHRAAAFYKIAASGAETNPTITHTGGNSVLARCTRFRGVDTANPFDVAYAASAAAFRTDDEVRTGTLTTVTNGAMLLFASHLNDNRTRDAVPTGWTDVFYSSTSSGSDSAVGLVRLTQATAGAAGPAIMNISGTAQTHGVILALRPASSELTIDKPAGTSQGDVMLASISVRTSAISVTPPAGWTPLRDTQQAAGDSLRLLTYYRVATTGEPANYTFTFSGGTHAGAVGGITSYSGVDTTTPIDAQAGGVTASATTHIAPTVSASVPDDMLVTVHSYASSGTWTVPPGMAESVDVASGTPTASTGVSMQINREERAASGATGTRTATASGSADAGATHSILLRAATLVCFSDNFDRANGAPGTGWLVSNSGGSFGNPVIANSRLRLTDASGNVATMATLLRIFPGAGNRIEVVFNHYAYGGNGADGIVLVLSDYSVTPAPGGYGGSLGYAVNTAAASPTGFAGGWLGIGIDEYGNFASPTEGRNGGPGLIADSITVRGSAGNYAFHSNSGALAPGVDGNGAAAPPHSYRIIIDHSNAVNAWVSVERNTGAGYQMLIAPYDAKAMAGQSAVPANWILSYTGSTGGSNNIHEIDNLEICATSQQLISNVNHYHITHSGTGINCLPEQVTIAARNSTNNNVTANGSTIQITARRVSGAAGTHGDWGLVSGTGLFSNGAADDGVATYTFGPNEQSAVFSLKNTHVQLVNIDVIDGANITEGSGTGPTEIPYDANLNFVNSAFRFSSVSGSAANIPNQTAGVASATQYLQAFRTDNSTNACVAAFPVNTNVNINLGYQCNDPTTCIAGQTLRVTNNAVTTALASNPNSGVSAYQSTVLRFGANGEAPFTLNYSDVGLVSLHARYEIPLPNGSGSGNFITGSSNGFVVKPYDMLLSNIERTSDGFDNPTPAADDSSDAVFIAAGSAFRTTVTAVNASGVATPNYGREVVSEGARLTSTLFPGLNLTANPAIANPTAFGAFTAGAATGNTFSWGEVGIINLSAGIGDGDYLGAGDVTGTASRVGRFRPFDFNVSFNTPRFSTFCGAGVSAFTYIGQNFDYLDVPVMTVTARNAQGGTTVNYGAAGGWFKISNATLTGKAYSVLTGTLDTGLVPAIDPVIGASITEGNANGSATLTFSAGGGMRFVRNAPVVPFNAEIALQVNVADSDGVTYASNPARFGAATAGNGIAFTQSKLMRFGRLHVFNALGSTELPLPVPMRLEYWNGTGFITNPQDSCTSIPAANVTLGGYTGSLGAGETAFPAGAFSFSLGLATTSTLSAPGPTNPGSVAVTVALGAPFTHLRGRWNDGADGDSDPATFYDDNAAARATFGLYGTDKAPNRFIYSRENY
jgi:MSHA biogenesis protein MshQ